MRTSAQAFLDSPNKRVTLLGMSGVGKTRLANLMRDENWFHYSVDYRIGTRYLDEPILDNIKLQANQVPFLRDLLRTDSIYIGNNITFDNLKPLSSFLGMLGNPENGGLPLPEFKRRQQLHLDAEVAAMLDVPSFVEKARTIYGYNNFLNDASGSFCEIDDPKVFEQLAEQTVFIYIEADAKDQEFLIERAAKTPKPLYYREPFLDEQLQRYQQEKNISYVTEISPSDFVTWVFPKLFKSRVPRYKAIAEQYGYTVSARDALAVETAEEFVELITKALD
ncbi:MAG: ATPase [Granulosicoccaceae bacterium]